MSWERSASGCYTRETLIVVGGKEVIVRAQVFREDEAWLAFVTVNGERVDQSEWDGRGAALRNARGAMKRAMALRMPCQTQDRREEQEESDDEF